MQKIKDRVEEQKCFLTKINKTAVESENGEKSKAGSQPKKKPSITSVEDNSEDLISFWV